MRNQMIPLLSLAACSFPAMAIAGDLEGRVLGRNGDGVANAFVLVEGTDFTAVTDSRGHFHFDGMPAGTYTVIVTGNDGSRSQQVVDISATGETSVALELSAALEKVVVQSSALGRGMLDLSQPVDIIGADELDALSEASIGETLSNQLGVNSTYGGPASGRPVIRGLSGSRVRVQQDGIASLDVSSLSPDHAVPIEPLLIDSVEIVKGPATLLYGNGAFGGVINMSDARIPEEAHVGKMSGAFEFRADTVSQDRTMVVRADGGKGSIAWHVDGFRRKTDEVTIPASAESYAQLASEGEAAEYSEGDRFLENSDIESSGGAFGISWIGDDGFVGISSSSYQSNYGVPGHAHEGGEEGGVRIDLGQQRFDVKAEMGEPLPGLELVKFRLGTNDYEHTELEGGEVGTVFNNDEYDGRIELTHAPLAGWRGAFGIQLRDRDFSAVGDEAYIPPTVSDAFGAFLVEEREFGAWRIELGIRMDNQNQQAQGQAEIGDQTSSLSAGAVYRYADNASLGVNLARAQRAPEIEERFSNGPHLATQQYEIGDASLQEETANNIDLTWKKTGEGLRWTVNLFRNQVTDFIYLENTGAELDGLPVARYTQSDAVLQGYEAEISFPLAAQNGSEWRGRLFSDYTHGELDDGGFLPRIPPMRVGAQLDYESSRVTFGVRATQHMEQDDTAGFELPTDSYTMVDADVSFDFPGTHLDWTVFIRGNNLLDEEARRHTSFLKDLAPLPGRNLVLGVRGRF